VDLRAPKNLLTQSSLCVHFQKNESIVAKIWRLIDEEQSVPEPENNPSTYLELSKLQNKKKLHFLYFLHNAFQKTIDEKSQASLIRDSNPRSDTVHEMYNKKAEFAVTITSMDFKFVLTLINWLITLTIEDVDSLYKESFLNLPDIYEKLNLELEHFHALLKISSLLLFLGGHNKKIQDLFTTDQCFSNTLRLFDTIYKLDMHVKQNPNYNLDVQKIIKEDIYFELYLNLLRLMSNVVHLNPVAQNYILNNNYLLLLINFSVIDETNPYIKEWSIILIRNLTEGNPAIQEKISKLKLMDFDQKAKDLLKKIIIKSDESNDDEQH